MIEIYRKKNLDILIGISTSGNSKNVVNFILKAQKEIGMITVGFTGKSSCEMDQICDTIIKIHQLILQEFKNHIF